MPSLVETSEWSASSFLGKPLRNQVIGCGGGKPPKGKLWALSRRILRDPARAAKCFRSLYYSLARCDVLVHASPSNILCLSVSYTTESTFDWIMTSWLFPPQESNPAPAAWQMHQSVFPTFGEKRSKVSCGTTCVMIPSYSGQTTKQDKP